MSTNTTNYNLVKPALTDAADITAMNGNWDTIDTQLKSVNDKVNAIPVATYIVPTVVRTATGSTTTVSVNPLPSTWGATNDNKIFANGLYQITSSDSTTAGNVKKVFDGDVNTSWSIPSGKQSENVTFALPEKATITKMKVKLSGTITNVYIYGSNISLSDVGTSVYSASSPNYSSLTEITLSVPSEYKYYRFNITKGTSATPVFYELEISQVTVKTYTNAYTIAQLPTTFTTNQRVLIEMSNDVNSFGTISNTLNGVNIDAILQPSKRYELVYNGTSFNATEV